MDWLVLRLKYTLAKVWWSKNIISVNWKKRQCFVLYGAKFRSFYSLSLGFMCFSIFFSIRRYSSNHFQCSKRIDTSIWNALYGENCLKNFLKFNTKILTNHYVQRHTYLCVIQKHKKWNRVSRSIRIYTKRSIFIEIRGYSINLQRFCCSWSCSRHFHKERRHYMWPRPWVWHIHR